MSGFITGRVESAKRSLIERAKATLRKHGEPCPDAKAAEIERLTRERDHWQATHAAERLASMNAEARATVAEAEAERLREALRDFVAMGEQYEWDSATTGRNILMRNARAALTERKP